MDAMNCDRAREALWPLERPRAPGEDEARAHLEACPECQAFFRRDARLSRRLEGTCVKTPCPETLRERLVEVIDRAPGPVATAVAGAGPAARPGSGRRVRDRFRAGPAIPWMIAAATILIAAVGLLRPGPRDLEAAFVQDYRTRAAGQTAVESPDIDRVAAFFLREVGFEAVPVAISNGAFTRAEVCFIDGRRAARVEYEIDGHAVAHYRVPADAGPASAPVHASTVDGVCVVRWTDGRFDHALVADIPETELAVLARREFGAAN